jgi:maltose alpha-D-glucosyltransferase/alpha-amylase
VLPTIELTGDWETVLEGPARAVLEGSALPAFLCGQRWFGGKARRLKAVRVEDWGDLPAGEAPAFPVLLRVEFEDGGRDLYFLALAVTPGQAGRRLLEDMLGWAVARLKGPGGEAVLHDALADDAVCIALLDAIGAGREFRMRAGAVRAFPTAAFRELRGDPGTPLTVTRGPATSSNSLIFYGRRLLLKLFRRPEVGINPDFEIGRFLTEESPFTRMPRTAGAVEYQRTDSGPRTLAILQELVANQADGWRHTLDEVGSYFKRVAGRTDDPASPDAGSVLDLAEAAPAEVAAAVGGYLDAAAALGTRTAEMHLALAANTRDPAFAPEPLTAADLDALRQEIRGQAEQALTTLRATVGRLSGELAAAARQLLDEAPGIIHDPRAVPQPGPNGQKIRCHGDYHLGQVLWADDDFVILDFEGEPTRTVEERRAKQSPLKDVAGMLRSFDYAAYAGLFAFTRDRPEEFARLEPWAEVWRQWVSAAFLRAYRSAAGAAGFLPAEPGRFAGLLEAFVLDKAFYELVYELNNRPDWVRIPLRGILGLLEQAEGTAGTPATKGPIP